MVGHQGIGIQKESLPLLVFPQKREIQRVIRVFQKDLLQPVAPGNHVVKRAGKMNLGFLAINSVLRNPKPK